MPEGILYHEAWHGVTMALLSKEEREQLYKEARRFRGKGRTYKGEVKKLSEFTDLEADEWLAEEFRKFVIAKEAGSTYKIGKDRKRNFIDKIFDFLSDMWNYFTKNQSEVQQLMSKIVSGEFTKTPTEEMTIYDIEEERFMSINAPTTTFTKNTMEGMTVELLNLASKEGKFELSDFIDPAKRQEIRDDIIDLYGAPGTSNTVYTNLARQVAYKIKKKKEYLTEDLSVSERTNTEKDITNLLNTLSTLKKHWGSLVNQHITEDLIKRFKVDLNPEDITIDPTTGKPSITFEQQYAMYHVDPDSLMPSAMKLLIDTLPASKFFPESGVYGWDYNSNGFPKLAHFGDTMNLLYKELSNLNPSQIIDKLNILAKTNRELTVLIDRLGINDNYEDKNAVQIAMIVQFLTHFNKANRRFNIQKIDLKGGRFILDANSNRTDTLIKERWITNLRSQLINYKGLGEKIDDELLINKQFKINLYKKPYTLQQISKRSLSPEAATKVLSIIGIDFSDEAFFQTEYENNDSIKKAVKWILLEVVSNPMNNLYKGDVHTNLKQLMNIEKAVANYLPDLQHFFDGKPIHGISLKTYAEVIIDKLNFVDRSQFPGTRPEVDKLLSYDNLKNSFYLNELKDDNLFKRTLKLEVLEGINPLKTKGKHISHSKLSDIAVLHIESILNRGLVPLMRTADAKTEYAFGFGEAASLKVSKSNMIERLRNYLKDEVTTAITVNSEYSKLNKIDIFKDKGGNLRFFKGIVPIDKEALKKKLTADQITELITSEEVTKSLEEFLANEIELVKQNFLNYKLFVSGKNKLFNFGLDQKLLDKFKSLHNDSHTDNSLSSRTFNIIAEQLVYEHMTGIIEQSKIFLGDFAQYEDLFKRVKGLIGTKDYATNNSDILNWMNTNMTNRGYLLAQQNKKHSKLLSVSTREEVIVDSPYYSQYERIIRYNAAKEGIGIEDRNDPRGVIVRQKLKDIKQSYTNMKEADGYGMIHFDAYRSLLFRTGKWSYFQEALYQKIMDNYEDQLNKRAPRHQIKAKDYAIFPVLKPQMWAPFVENNIRLMAYHKYALGPIIPNIRPNTQHDKIYADMSLNGVDYMIFQSAAKAGGLQTNREKFDPFYKKSSREGFEQFSEYKPLDPNSIQNFDFSALGIQVDMAPKTADNVPAGVQLNALLLINMFDNGELSNKFKNNEFNFKEKADLHHEINSELVYRDWDTLVFQMGLKKQVNGRYKINDISKLKTIILEEFDGKSQSIPQHTRDSIENILDSEVKFLDQLFEKNKIESILYSLFMNRVIRRKMNGDMMTLQPSTGSEVELRAMKQNDYLRAEELNINIADLKSANLQILKFYRKEPKNDDGTRIINPTDEQLSNSPTLAMQVMLPHKYKELGLGLTININDPRIDPELRKLIGFRIPTEALNSVEFMEVVGYLPPSAGSTIMVPSELVGKAGSDYDIDKLTIYFPNYFYDSEADRIRKVNYLDDSNSTVEVRLKVLKMSEFATYKKLFEKDKMISSELLAKLSQALKNNEVLAQTLQTLNEEWKTASKERREIIKKEHLEIIDQFDNEPSKQLDATILKEFSQLSIPQQNIKKALQNKIQDNIKELLEHPLMFEDLINPTGAFELEEIANEVEQLNIKRGKLENPNKNLANQLSFFSLAKIHQQLWSGIGGVGIVATSSTAAAKSQRAGINWNLDPTIEINFKRPPAEQFRLNAVKDINNLRNISSVIQQYMTGYVDVTKKDFIFKINGHLSYAPIHLMLARSRVPMDTISYFMSQPIITDFIEEGQKNQAVFLNHIASPTKYFKNDEEIVTSLSKSYEFKSPDEKILFNNTMLKSMIGKPIDKLSNNEKMLQVQILNDFIRYKKYSEYLLFLNSTTKFDTRRLRDAITIKYMEQGLERLLNGPKKYFTNVEKMISNMKYDDGTDKLSMITALKDKYLEVNSVYNDFSLKNYHKTYSDFLDEKIYEATDPDNYTSEEDILKTFKRFDNFVSEYLIQNIKVDKKLIKTRIKELFQGKDSLPNRIVTLQKTPNELANNEFIKELLPLLQPFDEKHSLFAVDGLKLRTKRIKTPDIDFLADAFLELQSRDPLLARDLIEFSILQSGLTYSPHSYFHAIPGTEVLKILKPYFNQLSEEAIFIGKEDFFDKMWKQFHQNNWYDRTMIRRIFVRADGRYMNQSYEEGYLKDFESKDDFIILQTQVGSISRGNLPDEGKYEYKLFERRQKYNSLENNKISDYMEINKLGVTIDGVRALIETGDPIIMKNMSKIQQSEIASKYEDETEGSTVTHEDIMKTKYNNIVKEKKSIKENRCVKKK